MSIALIIKILKFNKLKWKGNVGTHSTLDEGYDFLITDNSGENYHFKISTFECGSGLISEAIQVKAPGNENEPRIFNMLSDIDADIETVELLLKAKIKKGTNQIHLKVKNSNIQIGDDQILRGNISWNNNMTDTQFNHSFTIDGKRITIENFVKMIECYGGWNFKFQIFDISEDIE